MAALPAQSKPTKGFSLAVALPSGFSCSCPKGGVSFRLGPRCSLGQARRGDCRCARALAKPKTLSNTILLYFPDRL